MNDFKATAPTMHYFDKYKADPKDHLLSMAKMQGSVPQTCLLGGVAVMCIITMGEDPCHGCEGPRDVCKGRPK
jgi:hypothetical protein